MKYFSIKLNENQSDNIISVPKYVSANVSIYESVNYNLRFMSHVKFESAENESILRLYFKILKYLH